MDDQLKPSMEQILSIFKRAGTMVRDLSCDGRWLCNSACVDTSFALLLAHHRTASLSSILNSLRFQVDAALAPFVSLLQQELSHEFAHNPHPSVK